MVNYTVNYMFQKNNIYSHANYHPHQIRKIIWKITWLITCSKNLKTQTK